MNQAIRSFGIPLLLVFGAGCSTGSGSQSGDSSSSSSSGGPAAGSSGNQEPGASTNGGSSSSGAGSSGGGSGALASGSGATGSSSGSLSSSSSSSGSGAGGVGVGMDGGATGPASGSSSGSSKGGGSSSSGGGNGSGASPDAGQVLSSGGSDAAVVVPPGCTLASPVSFKTDVQPFLASSCGNGGGGANAGNGGCHVLDATSTVANGGYDHAYDWITGTAHASSCPEMPTPFRFQVVMAVINEADPPTCSKCDKMPLTTGADIRTPLTACQIATLQSWIDEPYVTQTHRNDGISPLTPYAMPPFN